MYTGKSYRLKEFIVWTRKSIFLLLVMSVIPTILYEIFELKWLGISWTVVALLGTATAFIVGFKNTQTYNRTLEAQQIWTLILNASRSWGLMCRDFLNNPETSKVLIYRHIAWLTALRYEMRSYRIWETTQIKHNTEYQQYYIIPERETALETELAQFLSREELNYILKAKNKSTQIMALQSKTLKQLYDDQEIVVLQFVDLQRTIKDFYSQQGRSEQLKDSPYPRQYAIINTLLVQLFCFLLPFGLLKEFDKLNEAVSGFMHGNMVWFVIPFSVIISWMYTSLGQVGESSENPFEGSPNDVPISQICKIIEIDLKEMLSEEDLPEMPKPKHNIIL
ncbi:bestrophin family protein [Flavobacterium reichenbachii]|uniref:Multidrug transporter n=1 Tax=Flavobacterium reichenbachii TaxID=362418 RepID=A0A085ZLQ0_9FLAO|nr:bestrophin family ion channel [Flavobacterium reichenbachii]KFF05364.1 multidrug transporter [Flavobacterium reichenbachii]OXB12291.1 multidrug transporter [Flavobacterium reichenbachii]